VNRETKEPPIYVLPFPYNAARPKHEQIGWNRLSKAYLTGSILLELEALTLLFTSSGSLEMDVSSKGLAKAPLRRRDVPCVAGSSIKGACRQVVEVLSQSDGPATKQEEPEDLVSLARSLFGTLGRRGHFSFDDAMPAGACRLEKAKIRSPYSPRLKAGRRFYLPHNSLPHPSQPKPRTLVINALEKGSRMRTTLRFTEAEREEIGWVLLGLGIGHFAPRLGGGKYDDLGRVSWRVVDVRLRQGFGKEEVLEDAAAGSTAAEWIELAIAALPPGGKRALGTLIDRFGTTRS